MEISQRELYINGVRLSLRQGDITRIGGDAIVNAANSGLMGGGGVDGAIHAAGGPAILDACREIVARQGRLPAGQAVITTGGNLPARYVIHTVGPVWHGGGRGEPETLAQAYRSCLVLAVEKGLATIAFPSISTGVYGYPVVKAARVALATVKAFCEVGAGPLREITFVLFSRNDYDSYAGVLAEIAPL